MSDQAKKYWLRSKTIITAIALSTITAVNEVLIPSLESLREFVQHDEWIDQARVATQIAFGVAMLWLRLFTTQPVSKSK